MSLSKKRNKKHAKRSKTHRLLYLHVSSKSYSSNPDSHTTGFFSKLITKWGTKASSFVRKMLKNPKK